MSTKYDNMTTQELVAELAKKTGELAKKTGQATKLRQVIAQRGREEREAARQRDLDLEPITQGLITFERRLDGKTYRYAAIRANGRWFTTGSTCRRDGYSWIDLLNDFIRDRGDDTFDVLSRCEGVDAARVVL